MICIYYFVIIRDIQNILSPHSHSLNLQEYQFLSFEEQRRVAATGSRWGEPSTAELKQFLHRLQEIVFLAENGRVGRVGRAEGIKKYQEIR